MYRARRQPRQDHPGALNTGLLSSPPSPTTTATFPLFLGYFPSSSLYFKLSLSCWLASLYPRIVLAFFGTSYCTQSSALQGPLTLPPFCSLSWPWKLRSRLGSNIRWILRFTRIFRSRASGRLESAFMCLGVPGVIYRDDQWSSRASFIFESLTESHLPAGHPNRPKP